VRAVCRLLLLPPSLLVLGVGIVGGSVPGKAATCIGATSDAATTGNPPPFTVDLLSGVDGNLNASGSDVTNTACGSGAIAAGSNDANTAIGTGAQAGNPGAGTINQNNTALGASSKAGLTTTTNNNLAVGRNASAEGGNATAIGNGASANFLNSTAIGNGATATRASQIVLGVNGNSYTLPGLASAGTFIGTTNQSGDIQFVTVDGSGNLGTNNLTPTLNALNTSINTINGNIATINNSITALDGRMTRVENALQTVNAQIENVGALSAALSSIPNVTSENRTVGCGIGSGGYGSGWAAAAGCAGKLASNVWLNGAVAFTGANSTPWGSTSPVAGRIGLFFQWGGVKN
jgi:hypothetical protein